MIALFCGAMAVPVFAGERSRVRTATSSCNFCQPAAAQESVVVRTRTKVRAKCNCESNCACDQGACACEKERKVVRRRSVTRSTCLTCN